ncbi:MAG TPA: ornithine cyclodeaminase family protein [Nocardioides sp.]|uniref:ornithine cyclodeaminase family protein n=1 Tax=uncultured Nocardioides sp. TaxID=198441 RepID=UPI002619FA9F|nr:ornithine cyclodeaminase family protein [uncultured Nocardioides sp.]HRD64170.1 ornithine cyclodeaminase family protein [Nocardioides sp.]HRK48107.1 ornithine cyclodeaminase family protein [Nocardioides sp.]
MPLLFLSDSDVAASLSVDDLLESQRSAYQAVVDGSGRFLSSAHASDPDTGALTYTRSGMLADTTGLTVKAGMVQPLNTARGLPAVSAMILLFDPETGRPVACLDGAALTLLRTSAGLAVAADELALDDAERLGVLGSGPQAEHTIRMMTAVRPIRRTTVWSPTPAHRERLVERLRGELEGDIVVGDSARAVVEGHDIVAACTATREPLVYGEWLVPGQTVLTMGSVEPDRREVDLTTTLRSTSFVDTLAQTVESCGPVVEALQSGDRTASDFTEIGAVLSGAHQGRTTPEEIVVFHSVGLGHQDAAAAWAAYRNATEAGLGVTIPI